MSTPSLWATSLASSAVTVPMDLMSVSDTIPPMF